MTAVAHADDTTFRSRQLGVERPALTILGACSREFARRALGIDPSVSLRLPRDVVLETTDAGTHAGIVDPRDLMADPAFRDLADEAATPLSAVVEPVATA